MTTTPAEPHWDLASIYPSLESEAFASDLASAETEVAALEELVATHALGSGRDLGDATATVFEAVVDGTNRIEDRLSTLLAYLGLTISVDAFDDSAQAQRSSLTPLLTRLSTAATRVTAWLGSIDVEALCEATPVAAERRYALDRAEIDARYLMSDDLEELAAALVPSGGEAWGRLHGSLTSRHTVRADIPGRDPGAEYALSQLKNLQSDADPSVRRAAFDAERDLLDRDAVAFAAAMNGVKGQVRELSDRRGWAHPLDASLHANAIDRDSLAAMQSACREAFPAFRRYFAAKAGLLGKPALDWWDLRAPLPGIDGGSFTWDEAKRFVEAQFLTYDRHLGEYARTAFDRGWIDVPPRKGKRSGAFCMRVVGARESRIMLNFGGTLDDVFTLAHELGHGYHNQCMFDADRDAWQRSTPMTLAETASIFCETIVVSALLDEADDETALAILEQDLQGTAQLVVDIDSRFRFEKAVFDRRAERELSIDEFRGIMLDAQAATYGEGLRGDTRHPDMWAQKGHYYSAHRSFYNYPYTFGYLFGLGLYAAFRENPDGFQARYRELLASTGMADAATLGARFGIDIRDPDFWRSSLVVARDRVDRFERLAAGTPAG